MSVQVLGLWKFTEAKHIPQGTYMATVCIDDHTIADETIENGSSLYVRGRVSQGYKNYVYFRHWHKAMPLYTNDELADIYTDLHTPGRA